MGSLARGWMFLRPVTDAVVSTPVLDRPYEFHVLGLGEEECAARDGELLAAGRCRIAFDPLERMLRELEIAAARYRVGDGTGAAGVAPASSVAQDAQQALLVALAQLRHEVNGDLVLSRWLREHEGDPTVGRWHELASFSEALRDLLVPYGRVQPAWLDEAGDRVLEESDRRLLAASEPLPQCSLGPELPVCELASPPTLYPRQALDTLLRVALEHGAQIWYLRSNQPGGTVLEGATLERPFAPVAPAVPAALVAAAPAAVE
jgi:predicted Abi (CAAX) family protease